MHEKGGRMHKSQESGGKNSNFNLLEEEKMTCTIAATDYNNIDMSMNESEFEVVTFKQNLREMIWNLHCGGVTDFYINSEYGVPIWAGETIIGLKNYNDIRLHIIVPYENQCSYWHEYWREKYYKVHEFCDTVRFASIDYSDECFAEADELMADESDMVLIFGDQTEKFHIAEYAKNNGVAVEYVGIDKLMQRAGGQINGE